MSRKTKTGSEIEYIALQKKGLTDKKIAEELCAYKQKNPTLYSEKLPTEMYDKVNLMCRDYMDRLARFEMDYDFTVDTEKFRNTAICCLEIVPVLRSAVINHPVAPYWKPSDYHIDDFVTVKETDNIEEEKRQFFSRQLPLDNNVQMNIGLFFCDGKTYICFIWNHMCMDGGGFRMFWADFCRNYSLYVNEGVSPLDFRTGSRKYTDVYKDMDKKQASEAKKQFANVSPKIHKFFPFEKSNEENNVIIVSRKIEGETFLGAKDYAKSTGASVTDILLAAYIDALGRICNYSENEKVSIACAVDLRRHMKDLSSIGYTNHVSFMHCTLDRKGSDVKETLALVKKKTEELKKDSFMGLHGLPLLNIAYKTMIYFQAEKIVKLFYNNPVFSVSNVGVIEPRDFILGEKEPYDAFVAGAAKNKPCAVMTALTINNCLSVSMCLRGNKNDEELLQKFFTEFETSVKALSQKA